MAKKKGAKSIGRNLCASFTANSPGDRRLKAELQLRLDEGGFDSASEFAKDLFRRGLQSTETDGEDDRIDHVAALVEQLHSKVRGLEQNTDRARLDQKKGLTAILVQICNISPEEASRIVGGDAAL